MTRLERRWCRSIMASKAASQGPSKAASRSSLAPSRGETVGSRRVSQAPSRADTSPLERKQVRISAAPSRQEPTSRPHSPGKRVSPETKGVLKTLRQPKPETAGGKPTSTAPSTALREKTSERRSGASSRTSAAPSPGGSATPTLVPSSLRRSQQSRREGSQSPVNTTSTRTSPVSQTGRRRSLRENKAGSSDIASGKGRVDQLNDGTGKNADKGVVGVGIPQHVLEQPLPKVRVPVTATFLKGGTTTPETRVRHAVSMLSVRPGTAPTDTAPTPTRQLESMSIIDLCFFVSEIALAGPVWRGMEREALQALFATMVHPSRKVSLAAGRAVASIAPKGDDQVFHEMQVLMAHDIDHVRLSALIALTGSAAYENEAVVFATADMLRDSNLNIRWRAVTALQSLAPKNHPMLLRSICLHIARPEAFVRAASYRSLGKVCDANNEVALSLLRQGLMNDPDMNVRIQALEAVVAFTKVTQAALMDEIKNIFNKFDKDGSGSIDAAELGEALRLMGHDFTEDELLQKVRDIDDESGGDEVDIDLEEFIKLLDKLDAESKRTAEKDWDPAVDSTSKKALSKREAKLLQDEKQNTFGKKEQAQAIFASNCAAVLASTQDAMGCAHPEYVNRASAALRIMMGGSESGADMVQEPHREQEGYFGVETMTSYAALRLGLNTPDVLGSTLLDRSFSPMVEHDDEWFEEAEVDKSVQNMTSGGHTSLREDVSPQALTQALTSPGAAAVQGDNLESSAQNLDAGPGAFKRKVKREFSPLASPLYPQHKGDSPVARRNRMDASAQEDMLAGVSEFDVLERSGVQPLPNPFAARFGTGVLGSGGFFSELPSDVRQGLGPIQLGIVGSESVVEVLTFWRGGRVWTIDVSDCVVPAHALSGRSSAIRDLEEKSFLSCTNIRTQQVFPHLSSSNFRFAAGPMLRSGRHILLFVYTDHALEVPLNVATSGSTTVDTSQPACKMTLMQALGSDFALALKIPVPEGAGQQDDVQAFAHENLATGTSQEDNRNEVSLQPPDSSAPKRSGSSNSFSRTESKGTSPVGSEVSETEEKVRRSLSKHAYSFDAHTVWGKHQYCGTGEISNQNGRVWYLFLHTHVVVFDCHGEPDTQFSRMLHGPRPIQDVIFGGPSTVSSAVGPLETVNWIGDGRWQRSRTLYLLHEDAVWEWDVDRGHIRRTIRDTTLHLDVPASMPSQAEDIDPTALERVSSTRSAKQPPLRTDSAVSAAGSDSLATSGDVMQTALRVNSSDGEGMTRLPSGDIKRDHAARELPVNSVGQIMRNLAEIMALGISEVSGMPMLRREKKFVVSESARFLAAPWVPREGARPPSMHVSLEGMIPSLSDAMGAYVIIDESWGDTDRPLYIHLPSAKPGAGPVKSSNDGFSRRLSNGENGESSSIHSSDTSQFDKRMSSGSCNLQRKAAASSRISRLQSINNGEDEEAVDAEGSLSLLRRSSVASIKGTRDTSEQMTVSGASIEPLGHHAQGWDLLRRSSSAINAFSRAVSASAGSSVEQTLAAVTLNTGDDDDDDKKTAVKAVESALAHLEHSSSVRVGEMARPKLFQRRPSLFANSADDVASIESGREKALSRSESVVSNAVSAQGSAWERLRSGDAGGICLRAIAGMAAGSNASFDAIGQTGIDRDDSTKQKESVDKQASGWNLLRKCSVGNLINGVEDGIDRTESGIVRRPSQDSKFSRLPSGASQKSAGNTDKYQDKGVREQEVEGVSFLFWRGPADPASGLGCWMVADSPASNEAAFYVESDAMDPAEIELSQQWHFWNGTDWEKPSQKAPFRVMSDGKMSPDVAMKVFEAVKYYRNRRDHDQTKEFERKSELKKLQAQEKIISVISLFACFFFFLLTWYVF